MTTLEHSTVPVSLVRYLTLNFTLYLHFASSPPNILLAHEEQCRAELLAEDAGNMLRQRLPLPDVGGEVARVAVLHHNVDELLVPAEVQHAHDKFMLQCFQGAEIGQLHIFNSKTLNAVPEPVPTYCTVQEGKKLLRYLGVPSVPPRYRIPTYLPHGTVQNLILGSSISSNLNCHSWRLKG